MEITQKVPPYIYVYTILITLFTALMVGFSIFAPQDFFAAYGINGDAAFQYSWSFRYFVILAVMVFGLIRRNPQALFITIFSRFLIDLFDVIGIFRFNTPPFSVESMIFLFGVLLLPQVWCLYKLYPLQR